MTPQYSMIQLITYMVWTIKAKPSLWLKILSLAFFLLSICWKKVEAICKYDQDTYRVFMMESTKSKQLLWDFLLKDHMVSWVNLIGIKRPFCETKSDFWYSEIFFSVHFGDISKGYPLEKCQNHHLLFEKLFHISKWPIKAFLKINFNLTLLYEKCPKYGSRCGQ